MTLGTDTIALLRQGVDALLHLTGPVPYGRLTPDERRSALMQLMVTAATAAKIAEVGWAPPNQSGGDATYISAETERLKAEAGKVERETERAARETERLKAEADKVRAETKKVGKDIEKVVKQIELTARETLRLKVEGEKVDKEAVRAVKETERIKAEAEKEVDIRVRELRVADLEIEKLEKAAQKTMQETTRLRAELDRVRNEQSTNDCEIRKLKVELEIRRSAKRDLGSSGWYFVSSMEEIEEDIEKMEKSLEGLVAGTERIKAEEDRAAKNLEWPVQETERLQRELNRLRSAVVL